MRVLQTVLMAVLVGLFVMGCPPKKIVRKTPPPLRPKPIAVESTETFTAKEDCEPTDSEGEDPAKTFRQRSIPESEKLAREGEAKLRSSVSKEIDPEYREQLLTEAVERFNTSLLADPYNVEATYNLAAANARIGRVQCSINLLKRLLQMRQHSSRAEDVEDKIDELLGRNRQGLDPNFNDMRGDVRFRSLIERMCQRDKDRNCVLGAVSPNSSTD